MFRYNNKLIKYSRENRNLLTKSELLLWNMVLRKDRLNYRFVRQKPIGPFIVDFYCSKLLLVIEVDGSTHESKENKDLDRDKYLKNLGIKTIRYNDDLIFNQLENVFEDMKMVVKEREKELKINPNPSVRSA